MDNLLEKIEQDKKLIEQEMELIKISREETFKIKKELQKELDEIREKKVEIFRKTYQEAEKILKETQSKVENIIENLGKKRLINKKSKSPLLKELREINEEIKTKLIIEEESIKNRDIKVGDYVRVKSLNKKGIMLAISEKSGKCKIQIDNMKIIVPIFDIEKIEKSDKLVENFIPTRDDVSKRSAGQDNFYLSKMKTFKNELSLRRFNVEDAKLILEKYLDDAYLLGISPVYIIHGKGKGVLREEVRKLLDNIPYVKSFKPGDANEGGIGVTVVYLKK